ncbi:hypothetical protein IV203_015212 [Nitzschia inconspicua]|uniref:Uncharacterized protein n=1 Tax=Nitzschia inconspicua TaxID=303405 RepID=A0A9K3LBT0_9STRA|nr:hypothetical protein IV203_015212 [Nitzschia inconspicua]
MTKETRTPTTHQPIQWKWGAGTADVTAHPPASPSTNDDLARLGNNLAVATDTSNSQISPVYDSLALMLSSKPQWLQPTIPQPIKPAVNESIATEATSMFFVGATFNSREDLREAVRKFAHKKPFSVTSIANRFSCSRCAKAPC